MLLSCSPPPPQHFVAAFEDALELAPASMSIDLYVAAFEVRAAGAGAGARQLAELPRLYPPPPPVPRPGRASTYR